MKDGYKVTGFTTILGKEAAMVRVELGFAPPSLGHVEVSTLIPAFATDADLKSLIHPSEPNTPFERAASWYGYVVAELSKRAAEGAF